MKNLFNGKGKTIPMIQSYRKLLKETATTVLI